MIKTPGLSDKKDAGHVSAYMTRTIKIKIEINEPG